MENRDIVQQAENVIKSMLQEKRTNDNTIKKVMPLKTNQIRKFLTAFNNMTNKIAIYKAQHPGVKTLSADLASDVKYLQVKLVYQVGREKSTIKQKYQPGPVERFVGKSGLIKEINNVENSIAKFEQLNRYVEALVAYHKFYGGKDT